MEVIEITMKFKDHSKPSPEYSHFNDDWDDWYIEDARMETARKWSDWYNVVDLFSKKE